MVDPPAWPYDIGPHDAVFALGAASVNYARLEFAFGCVFAKVLEITNDQALEQFAKTRNNYQRLQRMGDAPTTEVELHIATGPPCCVLKSGIFY